MRKRREQQRAIDTRRGILNAALTEFAAKGFDGASIRGIGVRTGLQHPLITYHFRTKKILWKAVAEDAFAAIQKLWDESAARTPALTPLERLRHEYFDFLQFTIEHPDFYHFMANENRIGSPRLPWLAKNILSPLLERLLPQIKEVQATGALPKADPTLIHYMMVAMMIALSKFSAEMKLTAGKSASDPEVVTAYLALIDELVFSPFC